MQRMPARMRCAAVVLAISLAAIACRKAAEPPPAQRATVAPPVKEVPPQTGPFAGCYRVEWRPSNPFPRYRENVPTRITLTNTPFEPNAKREFVMQTDGEWNADFTSWEFLSDTQARVSWGSGFIGISALVAPSATPGTLEGEARTFADVPEKPDEAKVKLVRVDC